jgi:D-alanyl-D-alanine carboxypeptidase (penicillin-binding protein 5/6)
VRNLSQTCHPRGVVIGAIALVILVSFFVPARVALAGIEPPAITAHGVFAFDPATGEVILSENAEDRLKIGSITKVVTALVVVDHLELDDELTVASSDMVAPGYSAMGLQPGDTLTTEQLLTGLLVVSGGDAAWTFARTIGMELCGCDDLDEASAAFVDEMNAKAADLGATDSHFANPDGEDDDQGYSTARDVAILYAMLQANPDLAAIAAEPSYSFTSVGPEATPYEGTTTNQLSGQHNVISAKTGSEIDAGGCIVFADDPDQGGPIIIAILGSNLEYDETTWTPVVDDRWTDAVSVIETIDAEWEPGEFLEAAANGDNAKPDEAANAAQAPKPTQAPGVAAGGTDQTSATTYTAPSPVEADRSDPVTPSRGAPLLVVTVATGVLAFAAVFSRSRIAEAS